MHGGDAAEIVYNNEMSYVWEVEHILTDGKGMAN